MKGGLESPYKQKLPKFPKKCFYVFNRFKRKE